MTFSMTMTLTNDSLILLGLMVVGLTLCLYGYCKEGGDAIGLQQQQQQHEAVLLQEVNQDEVEDDEALDEILKQDKDQDEACNRDQDDVLEEAIQDQTEDEARGNEALLEELLNQEEARNEANANEETAVDGGAIMVQQQYRVLYNPIHRHMWTIFRNPNAGMISIFQMITNIYNMGTWVSNPLQLQVQQASAGNNEDEDEDDDEEEEEEYNAGYFERKSSKLDYDKVCAIVKDLSNKFPAINHAMHAHVHLLRQMNLNVNELKYKFYVSIAEALNGCPEYVKWIVPYYRRSVPDELEGEEDDNSFSEVGINQDAEDDEVVEEATLPRVAAVSSADRRCVAAEAVNPCKIQWTNEPHSYNPFMFVHGGPLMVYDTTTTTTTSTGPYIRMNRENLTFQLAVSVVEESTSISNITTGDDVLTTFVTETRNSNPRIDLIPKQEDGEIFVYTIQGDTIQGDTIQGGIRYTSPEFRGMPLTDILGRNLGNNTTIITLTIESAADAALAATVTESPHRRAISFSKRNNGDNMNPTRTAFSFTPEEENDALDFDLSGNGDSNDENTTSNDGDKDVEEEDKVELEVETVMPRPLESTPGKLPRKLQSTLGKYWKDDDDNNNDDDGGGGGAITVPTKKRVAAAISAVTRTVRSKTKKKPSIKKGTKKKPGIKKGTKLKRDHPPQAWHDVVHKYHHTWGKYSHKNMKIADFLRSPKSGKEFTGTWSECNGFYKKYKAYKKKEMRNPSGDNRDLNTAIDAATTQQTTNSVFDFPSSGSEDANDNSNSSTTSSMNPSCRRRNGKRKRSNDGSNNSNKKKPN